MISITNLTTNASTYYWNFCSGNANQNPLGQNIGNQGNILNVPTYISLAKQGLDCFGFVSCQGIPGVARIYFGTSFRNNPISTVSLGSFGILTPNVEGIQIKQDNGNWYGFINNYGTIVRLDFGTSLWNTPTAFDIGPFPGMAMGHGLTFAKEGNIWLAFVTSTTGNNLLRFNFGTSLINIPTYEAFGNIGGFNSPNQIGIISENGIWYLFFANGSGNTLSRINFGNSLLNAPTGENLGNPGGFASVLGLTIISDCGNPTGYFSEYLVNGQLGKLTFTGGVGGTVTGTILGNIGGLNRPHSFSEIVREDDSLFAYLPNRGDGTLTRYSFPPCTNASVPSSNLYTPPPFSYNQPGTFNVHLIVDEGLPTTASLCQSIVVMPVPTVTLGPDVSICQGATTVLDAGAGFSSYLWSTGATTRTITVGVAGDYSVTVTKYGCQANDMVHLFVNPLPVINLGDDVSICQGQSATFDAGACTGCSFQWSNLTLGLPNIGTGSTYTTGTPGVYSVKKTSALGCINRDTIELFSTTGPLVTTGPVTEILCSGTYCSIPLTSNVPGAVFNWTAVLTSGSITGFSNGTGDIIYQMLTNTGAGLGTVTYTVIATIAGCAGPPVQFIVQVYPNPMVVLTPPSMAICSQGFSSIHMAGGYPGTTFSWSASLTSGSVTGFSGGVGDSIHQILINTSAIPGIVTYSITAAIAGCFGTPQNCPVIVNPLPVINLGPDVSICQGQSATFDAGACNGCSYIWSDLTLGVPNIGTGWTFTTGTPAIYSVRKASVDGCINRDTIELFSTAGPLITTDPVTGIICSDAFCNIGLTANVPSAQFSWTATLTSGSVTGFSNGAGNSITQQLTNTGTVLGTVTYTVIASIAGCAGPPAQFIVQVYPIPVVTITPLSMSLCSQGFTSIHMTGGYPGTTFNWSASLTSGNVTGFSAGTGDSIHQILHNTTIIPGIVTYSVTPAIEGCTGVTEVYPVTVNPIPEVTNILLFDSLCTGSSITIQLTANVLGSGFSWTATGSSAAVSGFYDGIGETITQQLYNSGPGFDYVTYSITPSHLGCNGPATNFRVNVNPYPNVAFTPANSQICSGTFTSIGLSSTVANTTFSWTALPSSLLVSGFFPDIGNSIAQQITSTSLVNETVTYLVIPESRGCVGFSGSTQVTIMPSPTVTFAPCFDTMTISTAQRIRLKGGLPTGGIYTGPGTTSGYFYPEQAGFGVNTINYSYTNISNCTSNAEARIFNLQVPDFNCGSLLTDIRNGMVYSTVSIGNQCWISSNINSGTPILSQVVQTDNCIIEKYCFQDNPANCIAYGGLYQWDEMMGYEVTSAGQGLCPPGWHVPTESDWSALFDVYLGNSRAGYDLKDNYINGFRELQGGVFYLNTTWSFSEFAAIFWSSTKTGQDKVLTHGMNSIDHSVSLYPSSKANSFPIRCLKD